MRLWQLHASSHYWPQASAAAQQGLEWDSASLSAHAEQLPSISLDSFDSKYYWNRWAYVLHTPAHHAALSGSLPTGKSGSTARTQARSAALHVPQCSGSVATDGRSPGQLMQLQPAKPQMQLRPAQSARMTGESQPAVSMQPCPVAVVPEQLHVLVWTCRPLLGLGHDEQCMQLGGVGNARFAGSQAVQGVPQSRAAVGGKEASPLSRCQALLTSHSSLQQLPNLSLAYCHCATAVQQQQQTVVVANNTQHTKPLVSR